MHKCKCKCSTLSTHTYTHANTDTAACQEIHESLAIASATGKQSWHHELFLDKSGIMGLTQSRSAPAGGWNTALYWISARPNEGHSVSPEPRERECGGSVTRQHKGLLQVCHENSGSHRHENGKLTNSLHEASLLVWELWDFIKVALTQLLLADSADYYTMLSRYN